MDSEDNLRSLLAKHFGETYARSVELVHATPSNLKKYNVQQAKTEFRASQRSAWPSRRILNGTPAHLELTEAYEKSKFLVM